MGFLIRSIIYICSRPIYYNTNTLPEISTSIFFFFAQSRLCETTKQKSYPTPSTFKWNPDLQPATCNLQPTTCSLHCLKNALLFSVGDIKGCVHEWYPTGSFSWRSNLCPYSYSTCRDHSFLSQEPFFVLNVERPCCQQYFQGCSGNQACLAVKPWRGQHFQQH